MLDKQGTGKSFIAGIRAKEMAGKMEKRTGTELCGGGSQRAVEKAFPDGEWISPTEKGKRSQELLEAWVKHLSPCQQCLGNCPSGEVACLYPCIACLEGSAGL